MRSLSAWTLPFDPVLPSQSATRRYVDAISIAWVGNVSGTWSPDWTMARQLKAAVTGALTITSPNNAGAGAGADGYMLSLRMWASSASQVITLDGGLGVMGGFPTSFQLPVNKLAMVVMTYSTDLGGRWTVLSVQQEQ